MKQRRTMAESDDKSASISASAATAALGGLMGSVSEKWNSSGASDAVARINANIPQGTKDMLSSASSKIQFRREHLRSPTVFFGFGEEKPEENSEEAKGALSEQLGLVYSPRCCREEGNGFTVFDAMLDLIENRVLRRPALYRSKIGVQRVLDALRDLYLFVILVML